MHSICFALLLILLEIVASTQCQRNSTRLGNPTYNSCNVDNDCLGSGSGGNYCINIDSTSYTKVCRPCASNCDCEPNHFCATQKSRFDRSQIGYCQYIEDRNWNRIGQPCQILTMNQVVRGVNDRLYCGLVTKWDETTSRATEVAWEGFCDRTVCKICSEPVSSYSPSSPCPERACVFNRFEIVHTAQAAGDTGHISTVITWGFWLILFLLITFCCCFCCCQGWCGCGNLFCGCFTACLGVCCGKKRFTVKTLYEKTPEEKLKKQLEKDEMEGEKLSLLSVNNNNDLVPQTNYQTESPITQNPM